MTEPTITCPKCKTEIRLTESLAAPLIESTRRDYEKLLAQKETDIAAREKTLREREQAVAKAKEAIDDQVAEKLGQERARIVAEEARKAKLALATDLQQKTQEITDLQAILKQREEKLAEAQKAQANLIRKQQDRIDGQRDELIARVERQLKQRHSCERVFQVRWRLV